MKKVNVVEIGKDSSGMIQRRGGQTTIHQMYENQLQRTKCFHIFSHSLIFIQPCFSFSPADKKKRTHKTPIHKIMPIPSLSWQIVCLECVVGLDMEIAFFSFPVRFYLPFFRKQFLLLPLKLLFLYKEMLFKL